MVQKIRNFSSDLKLKEEILSLVKPSYVDPTSLLEREFANNDTIYLIRYESTNLVAFFMTGDDSFEDITVTYMGLSAVRHEYKNSGVGKQVYMAQIEDSLHLQEKMQTDIWCWGTTATPSAFFSIHKLWEYTSPDINFYYSNEALNLAHKICDRHRYEFIPNNPFVLKNVAKKTKYSDSERKRIAEFIEKKNFGLFDKLNINEESGDRLLMVFKLPSWEKFHLLKGQ
ncbi:MAG: hypothetical protein QM763_12680 [Agriterribacter sp.]